MFCTNCGYNLTNSINYCPNCGFRIAVSSNKNKPNTELKNTELQSQINTSNFTAHFEEKSNKNNLKKVLKLVVLIVLLPLAILSGAASRWWTVYRLVNWYKNDE